MIRSLHEFLRRLAPAAIAATALLAMASPLHGQVNVSGQASALFLKSGNAATQYAVNGGRPTFGWRADVFLDAEITENILFLSNARMTQEEKLYLDLFAIRVTEIAGSALNAEAGLIDVPFGDLGDRRFPKTNPFLSLPLGREHLTSLRASDYEVWNADQQYTAAGDGVRLVDGALYDAGVKIFGTIGMLDYAVAVINGSVSSTGSYSGGLNDNHGLGVSARLALTPSTSLTFGVSGARGMFMSEATTAYYGSTFIGGMDPAAHPQQIVGLDVEYAYGHFTLYAEGFFNRWEFSNEYGADLDAAGASAELRFVPAARFTLAARVGALRFNDLPAGMEATPGIVPGEPWDHNVTRVEGAAGYRITREVLLKAVYQHVVTFGLPGDPDDDTAALELVASF